MNDLSLQLETTTVEQDRTLQPILNYLPVPMRKELLSVLDEMDTKVANQGLVIDDCKRRLSILKDQLTDLN